MTLLAGPLGSRQNTGDEAAAGLLLSFLTLMSPPKNAVVQYVVPKSHISVSKRARPNTPFVHTRCGR